MLLSKRDFIQNACKFLTREQIGKAELWKKLVDQFRFRTDKTGNYRGEYWGKIMRGAALICGYTKNDELYGTLETTVLDMLSLCTEDGITSHRKGCEFTGWDLWCRKYVAVGLEYFYDICRSEELKQEILRVLKTHLLAITRHIGKEEGKKGICYASRNWGGLNSCSILKSYVVAYKLTGEKKLLDFASYIVSTGGSKDFDFVQAAADDELPLCSYRYPKAYEATSFFEGLLEYGKLTNDERLLTACKNYARSLLKQEFTVVGSGACEVECFDYSAHTQTYAGKKPKQETCVTVSYMLYFNEMYDLTGESIYLDAMERSFYNAYLGALNETAPKMTTLPIDWYSPLVGGKRANSLTAGKQVFSDGSFYSCCTAMGPAGVGVFANASTAVKDNAVSFRFYEKSVVTVGDTVVTEKTDYPTDGRVSFTFSGKKTDLILSFRVPVWCKDLSLTINGKDMDKKIKNGFVWVSESLGDGDEIVLSLDMPYTYRLLTSTKFRGGLLCFSRGPIVYAADKRFTKIFTAFPIDDRDDPTFDFSYERQKSDECVDRVRVIDGKKEITLVDYASAGDTYDRTSRLNVFVPYRTGNPKNILACFIDRRL